MNLSIREWRNGDKAALAKNLNNPKVLNNLRDGFAEEKTMIFKTVNVTGLNVFYDAGEAKPVEDWHFGYKDISDTVSFL